MPAVGDQPSQVARIAELEARVQQLDSENRALQDELVKRGVKLSCARVTLSRALIAFEQTTEQLQRTQAQLVHSEKLASVGQLAAGVAHELNTPAGVVLCAQDTLRRVSERLNTLLQDEGLCERSGPASRLLSALDDATSQVETGALRIGETVKRLSAFASLDDAEQRPTDVRAGLRDTLAMLGRELEGRPLDLSLKAVPSVPANAGSLNQVFVQLLRNAIEATPPGNRIGVATSYEDGVVSVTVRDGGVGMDEERVARLFEPHLGARGRRVGAGMGLAMCARAIDQHGGEIHVESKPGDGSTFTVRLPVT